MKKRVESKILTSSSMLGQRRGFLLAEETLKIIIALISITFLVFFLTSLYFNNLNEKEMQQAERTLKSSPNSIKNNIANLKEGESTEVLLENPKGWYLIGFTEGEEKPNSCLRENCICICDKSLKPWKSIAEDCTELGVCLGIDDLKSFEEIEIISKERTPIIISKESEKISINKKL